MTYRVNGVPNSPAPTAVGTHQVSISVATFLPGTNFTGTAFAYYQVGNAILRTDIGRGDVALSLPHIDPEYATSRLCLTQLPPVPYLFCNERTRLPAPGNLRMHPTAHPFTWDSRTPRQIRFIVRSLGRRINRFS